MSTVAFKWRILVTERQLKTGIRFWKIHLKDYWALSHSTSTTLPFHVIYWGKFFIGPLCHYYIYSVSHYRMQPTDRSCLYLNVSNPIGWWRVFKNNAPSSHSQYMEWAWIINSNPLLTWLLMPRWHFTGVTLTSWISSDSSVLLRRLPCPTGPVSIPSSRLSSASTPARHSPFL